jgi:hypothetical protein
VGYQVRPRHLGGAFVKSFVLGLHSATVWVILAVAGITLIVAIALYFMTRKTAAADLETGTIAAWRRIFRILLAVTTGLGVLQVIFGLLLFASGDRPAEGLHFVYGAIVLGAIPVAYVYSDQKQVRRDIVIMGIAVIAVIGAAVRAMATG